MPYAYRLLLAFCASVLMATSAVAASVTVAGVEYPDTVNLAGSRLELNGAGVRHKAVFKVYTAGLYLSGPAKTTAAVYTQPGAKRLTITMLRSIDSTSLGRLFTRGMEDNINRTTFSELVPGILRMSQIFSDHQTLLPGETFTIDWIPGTGTVVTVKGVVQGEPFKEKAFFDAMMSIWLGDRPADWQLKDALLGKT